MTNKKRKSHPHAHVHRALVAALIGVVAVPTAMTGLFQSIDDDGINAVPVMDLRFKAKNDRTRVRQLRRSYWQAVDIYNETVRLGVDNIGPPDIADRASIDYYLDPENFSAYDEMGAVHSAAADRAAAPGRPSEARKKYRALAEQYRDLLDGYITAGYCPKKLTEFHIAGMYELCSELLAERKAVISPKINFQQKAIDGFHSVGVAPIRNLQNRLRNLQESLLYEGGTSVRPKYHQRPSRPRFDRRSNSSDAAE